MKVVASIRARPIDVPDAVEHVNARYQRFLRGLSQLPKPWGGDVSGLPASVVFRDVCWTAKFTRCLGRQVFGDVMYSYPSTYPDDPGVDDWVAIKFNPKFASYSEFVHDVAPIHIESMGAYVFEATDEGWMVDLAQQMSGLGFFPNGRFIVQRLHPAHFMDGVLTRRAFSMDPDDIRKKLEGHVPAVRLLGDGVYIVGSDVPLDGAASEALDTRLRELLGVPKLP